MVAPNEQRVVKGLYQIWVTLLPSGTEATVSAGPVGQPDHPRTVDIKPFLAAGLSDREALMRVADIAQIAVEGATR